MDDVGLVWEGQLEEGIIPDNLKDPSLFQAIIKGFSNFKVDYLFIHRRTSDNQVFTYNAANRDDAHTQIEKYGKN